MKLTGKCKADFNKWIENRWMDSGLIQVSFVHQLLFDVSTHFYQLPFEMQYGVYVDFFDSYDMFITDLAYEKPDGDFYYSWEIIGFYGNIYNEKTIKTRPEARAKAIEKANKIYNSKQ